MLKPTQQKATRSSRWIQGRPTLLAELEVEHNKGQSDYDSTRESSNESVIESEEVDTHEKTAESIETLSDFEETTEETLEDNSSGNLSFVRRFEVLDQELPSKKDFMVIVHVKYIDGGVLEHKCHYKPSTKIKDIMKDALAKITRKFECNIGLDEFIQSYELVIPSKDEVNDEISMEPGSPLWRYTPISGQSTHFVLKNRLKFHHFDRVALVVKSEIHGTKYMMFHTIMTVSKVIERIESRLLSKRFNRELNYGLFVYDNEYGKFLDGNKRLGDCNISNMDIVQVKKQRGFEIARELDPSQVFFLNLDLSVSDTIHSMLIWLGLKSKNSCSLIRIHKKKNNNVVETELNCEYDINAYKYKEGDTISLKMILDKQDSSGSVYSVQHSENFIIKSVPPDITTVDYSKSNYEDNKYPYPKPLMGELIHMQTIHGAQIYYSPYQICLVGNIYFTNYRICFTSYHEANSSEVFVDIPNTSVSRVEKYLDKGRECVKLSCKDFRIIKFYFPEDKIKRNQFLKYLDIYLFPNLKNLFAIKYSHPTWKLSPETDGWYFYNATFELMRMGVEFKERGKFWRISRWNETYSFAPTYPSYIAVPSSVTDEDLVSVGKYRSKARIPCLSWLDCKTGTSITRCSQPLAGVTKKTSTMDSTLVCAIRETQGTHANILHILDARPYSNAVANMAIGGGFELINGLTMYPGCEIEFLGIANIHGVRNSLTALRNLIESQNYDASFINKLANTEWLHHLSTILQGASKIVSYILLQRSCLVHCSDGWDRTPQLTSLAMIALDPYYRTIKGLCVLIEKEWCSFGHKFSQRLGHIAVNRVDKNYHHNERSPTFFQFLDCIYQLTVQYPCAFEFNDKMLVEIATQCTSCKFGTFLFDSECIRLKENIKIKTESLWSWICCDDNIGQFVNPFYSKTEKTLDILYSTADIRLWNTFYRRWFSNLPSNDIEDKYKQLLVELTKYENSSALKS